MRVVGGVLEELAEGVECQRDVGDVGVVVGCPDDSFGGLGGGAEASVEYSDGEDVCGPVDAGYAEPVISFCGDDSGDVCAVRAIVFRVVVVLNGVPTGE